MICTFTFIFPYDEKSILERVQQICCMRKSLFSGTVRACGGVFRRSTIPPSLPEGDLMPAPVSCNLSDCKRFALPEFRKWYCSTSSKDLGLLPLMMETKDSPDSKLYKQRRE